MERVPRGAFRVVFVNRGGFALAVVLVMTVPYPFAQAGHAGPGTHFDGIPEGCSNDLRDGCYHMRTNLNSLDTPIIDVLLVPPASTYPERDLRVMRQAVEMWDAGIHYLGRDMSLDWLVDAVEFNIFVDDDEFTTHPAWDPEIIVVSTNPVGGAGIGIDPFGIRGPCKGANPLAPLDVWQNLPGFDDHHGGHSGTYTEQCEGGGTTCYAINGAVDPVPNGLDIFGMFDLVAHEFGHCLSVGHVGDALDHTTLAVPRADIMSYTNQPHDKCVSSLDVEGFAIRMSRFILPAQDQLAENSPPFQVQHPDDHYYASSTGAATDCPQPDAGLVPGEKTDFYPDDGGDEEPEPTVVIESPVDGSQVMAGPVSVSGFVHRAGVNGLRVEIVAPAKAQPNSQIPIEGTASGGQSSSGFTCAWNDDSGASTYLDAGPSGGACSTSVEFPAEGDFVLTLTVDDNVSTAQATFTITIGGMPVPDGSVQGSVFAYNEGGVGVSNVVAIGTGVAGDPVPKYLAGGTVTITARSVTGLGTPCVGDEAGLRIYDAAEQLVHERPATVVGTTSECSVRAGQFVIPSDWAGRYYLAPWVRVGTVTHWVDDTSLDDPSNLKPIEVLQPSSAAGSGQLMPASNDPAGDALVPLTSMDITRVELVQEDADFFTFELEVDDMGDLPPSADLLGLGGASFKHGIRFCTVGGDAATAYPAATFGTDATGECYGVEYTQGVLGDTTAFSVVSQDGSGCGQTAPADLEVTVDGDIVTFPVPRHALTLTAAPDDVASCGAGGAIMGGTGLANGESLAYMLGQTRTSAGLGVTLNPTVDAVGGIVDPRYEFGASELLVADAGGPYAGPIGASIAVTGSFTGGDGMGTCAWSTLDDGVFAEPGACQTTVTFETSGAKSVRLTVSDTTGSAADDALVTSGSDVSVNERVEILVDDVVADVQSVDTSVSASAAWSSSVDLEGLTGVHSITANWYGADDVLVASSTITVDVNQAPSASIQGSPRGRAGSTVSFDGRGSNDPDGSVVNWTWDMGDGTLRYGEVIEHSYSRPGRADITLVVTDDDGATAAAAFRHIVQGPSPDSG